MKPESIIDLTILALTLLLVACVPALLGEYSDAGDGDAGFRADVRAPFLRHGVKL